MRPTQHPSNNSVLAPPPGATHDECVPLPVTKAFYPGGQPVVASFWRPSEDEKAGVAEGKLVQFIAWGHTHPPIYIGVDGVGLETIGEKERAAPWRK